MKRGLVGLVLACLLVTQGQAFPQQGVKGRTKTGFVVVPPLQKGGYFGYDPYPQDEAVDLGQASPHQGGKGHTGIDEISTLHEGGHTHYDPYPQDEVIDYDDRVKDKDWLPSPEDYIEDEEEEFDPNEKVGLPDDYMFDNEEEGTEDTFEDELWGSDDDPLYVPEDEGGDDPDDQSEEDADYVPDYDNAVDDYEGDDASYGDGDDEADDDSQESEEESDIDIEQLWGSDDDPEYVPEADDVNDEDDDQSDEDKDYVPNYDNAVDDDDYDDHSHKHHVDDVFEAENEIYDDGDDEADELNQIILELAILRSESVDPSGTGPDNTQAYIQFLQNQNLNLVMAKRFLVYTQSLANTDPVPQAYVENEGETPLAPVAIQEPAKGAIQGPAKGAIKGKRQTKSLGSYSQQHQQSGQNQGAILIDVAGGVEPLHGAGVGGGGSGSHDVSAGVEAVDTEGDSDSSFLGWLGQGWGHVANAADTVGDHVGDTFDGLGDKISDAAGVVHEVASNVVDTVHDAASVAVDTVHDSAHAARDSIVSAYYNVKGRLPELRERIQNLFVSFGVQVQMGADYCLHHLGNAVDQVREAEILDKLQQKLAEGNEEVTAFFTILGQKVTRWSRTQGHINVDAGLIPVDGHHDQEGNIHVSGGIRNEVPNFYQDQDIVVQMTQMVDSGILTQEDLELLSQQQQQTETDFLSNLYQQQSAPSGIQIQSERRRRFRSPRAWGRH